MFSVWNIQGMPTACAFYKPKKSMPYDTQSIQLRGDSSVLGIYSEGRCNLCPLQARNLSPSREIIFNHIKGHFDPVQSVFVNGLTTSLRMSEIALSLMFSDSIAMGLQRNSLWKTVRFAALTMQNEDPWNYYKGAFSGNFVIDEVSGYAFDYNAPGINGTVNFQDLNDDLIFQPFKIMPNLSIPYSGLIAPYAD